VRVAMLDETVKRIVECSSIHALTS
jgi:hypothetical protein